MRIKQAPRTVGIDTVAIITAEQARALYKLGVRTVFRYLDRVTDSTTGSMGTNLAAAELAVLLDAGLCVSPVQYYSTRYESQAKGQKFSAGYGAKLGRIAMSNADALGLPSGITVWYDLEDVEDASPAMVREQCEAWGEAVISGGREPGLYVGSGLGSQSAGYTTGKDLYALPYYRSYWRAASAVPEIPGRGYCVIQGSESKVDLGAAGVLSVDWDMIALDHKYPADRARGDQSPGRFFAVCA